MARSSCLYCGAALPAESVAAAAEAASKVRESSSLVAGAATAPAEESEGQLLVVDVGGSTTAALERALGLPRFEAEMRLRRGGLQLHRRGSEGELRDEAKRLEAAGLPVFLVTEAEARRRPVPVTGGRQQGGRLLFRTETGSLDLSPLDLLLIVRGPIRREYQAREIDRKKPHTATLEEGFRFHLHRKQDPSPLELDPASFAFGTHAPLTGSSLLELKAWLEAIGEAVPVDDGFKLLPPALGAAAEESGSLGALRGTRSGGLGPGREPAVVLDNVAQFRFYSGWRAAIERQRSR
jgi:hypothetical protein